ncbi:Rv3654c family TadE-like protein [Catenulispora yoronensis]|uniref:Rv3654c family TadE-like protein n=1 Tax=Catenulispora yoronensis TaxID=450799 RepID=UPI0031E1892C
MAVLALGAAVLARHRAGSAADLAALSAAVHTDAGPAACDWARRTVAAQRAELLRCACDGPVCLVRAAVGTPWGTAAVTSRAGPAAGPQPAVDG